MATLNTLRTKYGIVLSIVIAVVLLAFILGDQLNNRQGPQQYEDFAVAQIAGKTIYSAEYAKAKQPADERKNLSADQAADLAWRTIVFDNYISPACAQAGIVVTQAEMDRVANMYGVQWGQQFEAAGFPQEQIASLIDNTWYVEQQTIAQQMLGEKFGALYALGAYTNKLEVADNIRNMGAAFSGKYVEVPYSVIADADVEVSEQDLAACYEAGKQKNPSLGNRTIRYMLFEIAPTEDDLASVEAEVKQAAEQLSSADMAQAKSVARSFAGEVSPYITFDRIPAAQTETLKSGAMYGPENLDNAWVMSRIVAKADVPATFRLEYAVFDDKQQADKIAAELATVEGDFTKLSTAVDTFDEQIDFNGMDEYRAKSFIDAEAGDIITFNESGKVLVAKVVEAGDKTQFVQVAQIVKQIKPSDATVDAVSRRASTFDNKSRGSAEAFQNAADEMALIPRMAVISRSDRNYQTGERGIRGVDNSRNVAVWAYGANVGESKLFNTGSNIIVAMVTAVDNDEYTPRNDMQCRRDVLRDKKFAQIAANLSSFEAAEAAYDVEVKSFDGVKFSDMLLEGGDGEARLIGAIAATRTAGELSQPIKGNNAAYIFVVDSIEGDEAADAETLDKERIPLNTQREAMMRQASAYALTEKAEIKDLRDNRVM